MDIDQEQATTQKTLGFWTLTALVAGNMIGSGVFLLPASLASFGSIGIVAWGLTALGAMVLALIFSRLSRVLPKTGGPYAYCREAYGDFVGFQVAYCYWMALWIGNAGIIVALNGYLSVFWPALNQDSQLGLWVSLLILWAITAINVIGVRAAGVVQVVTTILKMLPLFAVGLVGIFMVQPENLMDFNLTGKTHFSAITGAAALTLWAFIGLESATIPAGNVINPKKNIPRATLVGTGVTGLIYILTTVAVMGVVPMSDLAQSSAPYADAARMIFGSWGG